MKKNIFAFLVGGVLFAIDLYLGFDFPWWTAALPAFFVGWLIDVKAVRTASLAAIAAWTAVGLYFDVPTGFRLSMRIAGVMKLPGSAFAYLATAAVVGVVAALAAFAGASLRQGLFQKALGPAASE